MTIHSTLTSKYQTTIPKPVREALGLKPGDKVHFALIDGRAYILPKTKNINDLAGCLKRPGQPVLSLEDMDDAIAEAAAESNALK